MTCLCDGLKRKNIIFRWTKKQLSKNTGQMLICAWKQWLGDPQNSCFSLNRRHHHNEDDAIALKSSEGSLDLMADRIWGLSASELRLFLDISWDVVSQVCASLFKGLWSKKRATLQYFLFLSHTKMNTVKEKLPRLYKTQWKEDLWRKAKT